MNNKSDKEKEEQERQLELIHNMARRIPWILVIASIITTAIIVLQILLFGRR